MEELKNKFIDAINGIDFNGLTINELAAIAEIAEKVDKMAKKDYADMLAETMEKGFKSEIKKPKSIGELKEV